MQERVRRPIISDTATGWLKVIALVFMFVDHSGKMLFSNMTEMRMLGRVAFPLYAWCLVVGFHYTRSVPKYLLRILAVGLISQPLYMVALRHTWLQPNVLLTLLVALCALWALEAKRFGSHIWGPILAIVLSIQLKCDYGWRGVALVLLLYAVQDSRAGIAAVMFSYCLFWGSSTSAIVSVFGLSLQPLTKLPILQSILPHFLHLQTFSLLSLPFILVPVPRKNDLKLPQWAGYAIYPGHLAVLWLLEQVL